MQLKQVLANGKKGGLNVGAVIISGRERAQVVVKATDRAMAIATVREAVAGAAADRALKAAYSVDVDPQ